MKAVLSSFIKLFSDCIVMLSIIFASFLLLINLYHYINNNYKYYNNISTNDYYLEMKKQYNDTKTKIKSVNVDKLSNLNKKMMAKTIEGQFDKCFSKIENSNFYKLDKETYFSNSNIYEYNNTLDLDIQNECMFLVNYKIKDTITSYGKTTNDYTFIDKYVTDSRDSLLSYTSYLRNRLLSNSSYSFMTESSRNSIYNEVRDDFLLNMNNYNNLINSVGIMGDWYVSEFGGNK